MKCFKLILVVLVLALVLQPVASFAEAGAEKIVLTAYSRQTPSINDFDDNDLTIMIEDMFNVDIQWTLTPDDGDGSVDKQNILFASGDYPAVIMGGYLSQIDQLRYGKSGMLLPLNDLIDQYAPNIKKAFEASPYLLKGMTALDGNIYGISGLEECYHCDYSQKLWLNVEWLKNLGLEMPTTTDELYTVLKAFKEGDPNGNGIADEIPLSGCTDHWHSNPMFLLMCSFGYITDDSFLMVENGVVDTFANKPGFKEGLAYIHKLYSEGLIDAEAFTQNQEALKMKAEDPDTVLVGSMTVGCCIPATDLPDSRWCNYEAMPPLKGPDGTQNVGFFGETVGEAQFAITDKATEEQQIAAIKIADYFFTRDGALDAMYGPKGIGWWDPEEGDLGINGEPALYRAEEPYQRADKRSVCWDLGLKYTPVDLFDGRMQSQDITSAEGYEVFLKIMTDRLVEYKPAEVFPYAIWYQPEEVQALAQIKTDVKEYIKTNGAQFISGALNLETDWDAYVEGFNGLNLSQFIEASQKAYDSQYKN